MRARSLVAVATVALALMGLGGCPPLEQLCPDPNCPEPNCPEPNCPEPNSPDPNTPDPNATDKSLHEKIFTEIITDGFQDTSDCMICHSEIAHDLMATGHWKWEGTSVNIEGAETETHGKMDLLNNFCIAVPSNEGRCSQCHPSFGWKSSTDTETFFAEVNNVDCLVCHDTTGTYRKHPSANGGGGPAAILVDGAPQVAVAADLQEIAYNVGTPSRSNCGLCHYFAGGGDNVKHGDLSTDLNDPDYEADVHMGGLDFSCQVCHTTMDHGIAGMALHSVDEGGESPDCTRCHGATDVHEDNPTLASLLNLHLDTIACQTCHIPTFARVLPTKVEWYWSEAGQDVDPIPTDEYGKPLYDKKKGRFVYAKDVTPSYMWFDGKWSRMIIGQTDFFTAEGTVADPVIIASPTATSETAGAKIYPFKKMIGDQPADADNNILLVPHLFGKVEDDPNLDNPFWGGFEWGPALEDGAAFAGQTYSGNYEFVNTVMYLSINHEIAPAEDALSCNDCHGQTWAWDDLGVEDPLGGL